jgi:hypothetical protein
MQVAGLLQLFKGTSRWWRCELIPQHGLRCSVVAAVAAYVLPLRQLW